MRPAIVLGLFSTCGFAGPAPGAEGIVFEGPLTIGLTRPPVTVQAGDFNKDGKADLVCASGTGILSVHFQDSGDRRKWTPTEVRAGTSSNFALGGDFDGDGADDLLVADSASIAYFVRSRGDGTFDRPISITQAHGPRWVTTGDWNQDGRLDCATSNLATGMLTIFVNEALPEGGLRFRLTQSPTNSRPHALEAIDFDGDGLQDLLVGMGSVGMELHRGAGDGKFTFTPSNVGEVSCAQYLSVGDFNADGKGDVAPTCADDGTAYVGISKGDGNYVRTLSAPFASGTESSAAADLTRDGKDDLILASASSGQLRVYPSLGDGDFGIPLEFAPAGVGSGFLIAADLDGDGLLDVVSADTGGATLTVFFGKEGERLLESADTITGFTTARGFGVGDLDGDGAPDVILTSSSAPEAYIYLKPGGRSPTMPSFTAALRERYRTPTIADLNDDGIPDLAGTNFDLDSVVLALLDAEGKAHGELTVPVGDAPQEPRMGRIDPGPTLDLAVPVQNDDQVTILFGNGDGKFDAMKVVPTIARPKRVALGDLNNDRRADLVVIQAKAAGMQLQNEDGTFAPPVPVIDDPAGNFTDVTVLDLNGDGFDDIVLTDTETRSVLVFPGRGDGTLGEGFSIPVEILPFSLQLTDVDGDGRVDVTVSSTTEQSVAISLNLGAWGFLPLPVYRMGIGVLSHSIQDMNGDGVPDILGFGTTSVTMRLGSREGTLPEPIFRRGDATGDGKVDITDGVYILNYLFVAGQEPLCREAANANDDPALDLTDAIHVLRFLFLGDLAPLAPGPEACGGDPPASRSAMGCEAYGSCG